MARHVIPKMDLLSYALEGAQIRLGISYERLTPEARKLVQKDIEEIKKRMSKIKEKS